MKPLALCILALCFFIKAHAQVAESELFDQKDLKLISSQFKFTEGPSVDKKGNIFFTDQPNNTIWKYTTDGKLSLYTDKAGRANGTYVDKAGNLIVCADEHNELWIFNSQKVHRILYKNTEEKALNGPNDLWIDTKGGIYFTDPYYQRDYWTRQSPALVGEKVYYLPQGATEVIEVESSLSRPNGIVGTPDGKFLYVADSKDRKIFKYQIEADGRLVNKTLLINQGSDGLTLDELGNIYLTGKGIDIFQNTGTKIGHIDIPENHTANLCFGGKKRDLLFITASKSIYILPMKVRGIE